PRPPERDRQKAQSCFSRCPWAWIRRASTRARIFAEDRIHRRVDLLLRGLTGGAGQVLVGRGMPQGLTALGLVQVHTDDPFAIDIGSVPAPTTPAAPSAAPVPESSAPAIRVATLDDVVRPDAVADQAVGVAVHELHPHALQVAGDRRPQAGLIHRVRDRGALRAGIAAERAGPGERSALDLA